MMTHDDKTPEKDQAIQALKVVFVGVIGQVGCLTLVVIIVALLAGLWLDNQFQTRPLFVIILLLASVPLTIFLMIRVVLSFAPRIQSLSEQGVGIDRTEETEGGEHRANPS